MEFDHTVLEQIVAYLRQRPPTVGQSHLARGPLRKAQDFGALDLGNPNRHATG